jgi:hypothetical protein
MPSEGAFQNHHEQCHFKTNLKRCRSADFGGGLQETTRRHFKKQAKSNP